MSTQSIRVILSANVANYIAGMNQAVGATKLLAGAGALMVGATALGVKSFADFDQAMSYVRANAEGTPAEFAKLGESVRSVGKDFGYSAVESANGAEELAKAGLSLSEIMGGALTGSLTLAAAGGVSVAEASETAATAMSMFKLEGKDVGHIADILASGANASTASVGSLSQALRQGGGVAASFGVSLEDTIAALAMFDQNGLKGADAGTSLKTMLTALANPSKKAAEAMADLGIEAFDASGKFIGLAGLQDVLKTKMAGLTQEQRAQAMATIFGSDAMRAANVLFSDTKGMQKWRDAVDQNGAAAKNAGTRMDNLKGDLTKLKAAFMDVMIGQGSNGGFLRPVTQGATAALNAINALPGPIKNTAFGLVAAGGAGLLAVAGITKVAAAYGTAKTAIVTYTTAARAAATANGAFALTNVGMHAALSSTNAAVAASAVNMGRLNLIIAAIGTKLPIIAAMQSSFYAGAAGAARFQRSAGLARIATDAWAAASARASVANWSLAGSAKAVGAAALVVGAAFAADKIADWGGAATVGDANAKKLSASLAGLAENGQLSGEALKVFGKGWGPFARDTVSASDALEKFSANANEAFAKGFWDNFTAKLDGGGQMGKLKKMVEELDGSLTYLVKNGKAAEAKKQFDALMSGVDPDKQAQVKKMFTGYNDALAKAGKSAAAAKSPTQKMAESISGVGDEADQAKQDVDSLTKAIKGMGSAFLDEQDGAIGYQDALASVAKSLKENGRNSNIATEGGRANRKELLGLATQTRDWAAAIYANTGNLAQANSVLSTGRTRVQEFGRAMNMSQTDIDAITNSVLNLSQNGDIKIGMSLPGAENVTTQLDKTGQLVYAIKGTNIQIPVNAPGAEAVTRALAGVKGARQNANGTVTIPANANTAATMKKLADVKGARIAANGDVTISTQALNVSNTIAQIQSVLNAARSKTIFIDMITRKNIRDEGRFQADGGIRRGGVQYMADGGVMGSTSSMPAFIAKRGSYVVMAEDETDGEAYIPFAASKRPRSRRIAAETVRRLGGSVKWFADGALTGSSPNMSAILALISNLTYDAEKSAWDAMGTARTNVAKVVRDLAAARQKLAEDRRKKGVKASTIIADQNKVNDLLAKQTQLQNALNASTQKYTAIKSARSQSAGDQFINSAASSTRVTKQFLDDCEKIIKAGFKPLGLALLNDGSEDSQRIARSLAAGGVAKMKAANAGVLASDAQEQRRKQLLEQGNGAALTQQQRLEANARALSFRAANGQLANQSAVVVRPIIDTNGIIDGIARKIRVQVLPGQTVVQLDSSTIATATTQHQATQASYGTTAPGVNL